MLSDVYHFAYKFIHQTRMGPLPLNYCKGKIFKEGQMKRHALDSKKNQEQQKQHIAQKNTGAFFMDNTNREHDVTGSQERWKPIVDSYYL